MWLHFYFLYHDYHECQYTSRWICRIESIQVWYIKCQQVDKD